jgi:lipoprotein-anchoring transpeptidase ErfK/SrfK
VVSESVLEVRTGVRNMAGKSGTEAPTAALHDTNTMALTPALTPRRRGLIALCVAAMLGLAAVVMAESNSETVQAYGGYQTERTQFDAAIAKSQAKGFTPADLQPITDRLAQIEAQPAPIWIGSRSVFYREQAGALAALRGLLSDRERSLTDQAKGAAGQELGDAKSAIDNARGLEVDATLLDPMQARYDSLNKTIAAAVRVSEFRAVARDAKALVDDATKAGSAQQAENDVIQAAATALAAKDGNSIDAVRKEGRDALFSGRNDATIAAYESKPGRFAAYPQVAVAYSRLEHYVGRLDSSNLSDVAIGAAALQRYGGQIHTLLMLGLGPKHVILSFEAQHVWAYENGKLVMDTPATTGVRGNTAYGTDFGPMKIISRSHPFKMHSPWPQGSQYWYPDATVQWASFFTSSGEAFHDASWQADSTLGPGSQYQSWTRSHGCVHITYSQAQWMFSWADEGTPVDVYPGDGTPVAQQLKLMTTDDQGNPLNPA